MTDQQGEVPVIQLPVWLQKGQRVNRLKQAGEHWWNTLRGWLTWALDQQNAEVCCESALERLAWQRQIDRIDGEPLEIFRRRVQHAYVNARDAGSQAGFLRIMRRLELPVFMVLERTSDEFWDLIEIHLVDSPSSISQRTLYAVIQTYGRTARRYFIVSNRRINIPVHCSSMHCERQQIDLHYTETPTANYFSDVTHFEYDSQTSVLSI